MFKPSLMQVSHEGWHAFNKAHSGMNEIRQLTDQIPGTMREVLNILLNMQDEEEVAALLPISLKSLEDVADSCLARSKEVEDKFNSVRELIDELLQSSKDVYLKRFSYFIVQVLALSQLANTRRNPWSSVGSRKRKRKLS